MHLHDRAEGEGLPIILLHGLFGSGDNLGVIARPLATEYRVHSMDLRNHGRSPHAASMTYPEMAQDVLDTMEDLHIDQAIVVGHSMGGKVAMELAMSAGEHVTHLVVADIAPVAYPRTHSRELDAMRNVDLDAVTSRKDADAALAASLEDPGVRQFLLKNLTRTDTGFAWRIPLEILAGQYQNVLAAPSEGVFDGPTLFLAGGQSRYILDEHQPAIDSRFPRARIEHIAEAGHWIHNDAPQEFVEHVTNLLDAL